MGERGPLPTHRPHDSAVPQAWQPPSLPPGSDVLPVPAEQVMVIGRGRLRQGVVSGASLQDPRGSPGRRQNLLEVCPLQPNTQPAQGCLLQEGTGPSLPKRLRCGCGQELLGSTVPRAREMGARRGPACRAWSPYSQRPPAGGPQGRGEEGSDVTCTAALRHPPPPTWPLLRPRNGTWGRCPARLSPRPPRRGRLLCGQGDGPLLPRRDCLRAVGPALPPTGWEDTEHVVSSAGAVR